MQRPRPMPRLRRPIPDWMRNAPPEAPSQTALFQPVAPVGTGLYGVDATGQTWQYVPPGVIPLTQPGGPFLPTSGGTMSGPLIVTATGATTPRSVQDRWGDVFNVKDFGAVGDGVTDDSAALRAAANAALAAGGGSVSIGRLRLYVASSVNVPYNVSLQGEFRCAVSDYVANDWYDFGSQIMLATGATVTINSGNCERILFIHAGLYTSPPQNPTDATNLVANFGGIGVSAAGTSDTYISECMFLGFTTGIDATNSSRINVIDCRFDCTNGIFASNSSDVSRYHRNHFWPFLTNYIPGVGPGPNAYLPLQRAGYAIKTEHNTWDQFIDCFQFGYYQGFWCDSCSNQTFVSCHSDYTTPADNSVAGFQFTGNNNYSKLIGSFVVSCNVGILINESASPNPVVEVIGGTFAVNQQCINVINGAVLVHGATFEVGTVGVAFGTGTTTGAVIGCNFNGVTTGVTFANATVQARVSVLGNTVTVGVLGTGEQLVTNGLTVSGGNLAVAPNFNLEFASQGNGTDQNLWGAGAQGGGTARLSFGAWNDAANAANEWLGVTRTGYVPQTITLTAPHIAFGSGLIDAANDAAAAAGGVAVNGLYRNGSVVQIRVT